MGYYIVKGNRKYRCVDSVRSKVSIYEPGVFEIRHDGLCDKQ